MFKSQRHDDFVREPMKDKPLFAIAGVGEKAEQILIEKGYEKAYHLLGQFLVSNKDEAIFDSWLIIEVPSMNSKHREDCIACLKEWCEKNL